MNGIPYLSNFVLLYSPLSCMHFKLVSYTCIYISVYEFPGIDIGLVPLRQECSLVVRNQLHTEIMT